MNPAYSAVARRAGHRCEYCRAPEAAFNFQFEIEHIHPVSAGGSSEFTNLALGCRSCNLFKSDATSAKDSMSGEIVRLFHPRMDSWQEHFNVQPDGVITANTSVGRATIETLNFNSPRQLAARRLWMMLNLFPGQD